MVNTDNDAQAQATPSDRQQTHTQTRHRDTHENQMGRDVDSFVLVLMLLRVLCCVVALFVRVPRVRYDHGWY